MDAADLLAFLDESFPQAARLRVRIEHVDEASIRLRLPIDESHLRPGGTVSGPSLVWLADLGAYLLILAQIGRVALAVTTNINMNFLRRAEAGRDLIGEARLLKLGRQLAVVEVSIRADGSVEPAAQATLTYSIPPRGAAAYGVR
jgi:uncharacterized protein (TIGR00369 family)